MYKNSVQILCPYHSGSNLLSNILKAGFKLKISNDGSTYFHKHVSENIKNKISSFIMENKNILFIILIKNFPNWILSIKKEKYYIEILEKDKNILESKINIIFPSHGILNEHLIKYFSLCDLYNSYINFYKSLKFENVILFNHDDLIFEKEIVLNKLSLYLEKNIFFNIDDYTGFLNIPQKLHGNPNYGSKLFNFYKTKDINGLFSEEESMILKNLEKIYGENWKI